MPAILREDLHPGTAGLMVTMNWKSESSRRRRMDGAKEAAGRRGVVKGTGPSSQDFRGGADLGNAEVHAAAEESVAEVEGQRNTYYF